MLAQRLIEDNKRLMIEYEKGGKEQMLKKVRESEKRVTGAQEGLIATQESLIETQERVIAEQERVIAEKEKKKKSEKPREFKRFPIPLYPGSEGIPDSRGETEREPGYSIVSTTVVNDVGSAMSPEWTEREFNIGTEGEAVKKGTAVNGAAVKETAMKPTEASEGPTLKEMAGRASQVSVEFSQRFALETEGAVEYLEEARKSAERGREKELALQEMKKLEKRKRDTEERIRKEVEKKNEERKKEEQSKEEQSVVKEEKEEKLAGDDQEGETDETKALIKGLISKARVRDESEKRKSENEEKWKERMRKVSAGIAEDVAEKQNEEAAVNEEKVGGDDQDREAQDSEEDRQTSQSDDEEFTKPGARTPDFGGGAEEKKFDYGHGATGGKARTSKAKPELPKSKRRQSLEQIKRMAELPKLDSEDMSKKTTQDLVEEKRKQSHERIKTKLELREKSSELVAKSKRRVLKKKNAETNSEVGQTNPDPGKTKRRQSLELIKTKPELPKLKREVAKTNPEFEVRPRILQDIIQIIIIQIFDRVLSRKTCK
jgi:hypothetical protein